MLRQKNINLRIVSVFRESYITIAFGFLLCSLIFSFQPLISFGTFSGINLKLSLVHIATLLFILVSVRRIYQQKHLLLSQIGVRLFLFICTLSTLGILWSINKPRGLFMSIFLWILFFLFISIQANIKALAAKKEALFTVFMSSILFACVFAWWQIFAESLSVPPSLTLLPQAYQASTFGFARPTAFSLEPQFLGSLLLLPILIGASLHLKNKGSWLTRVTLIAATVTLILTISRGALIGLGLGLLILVAFSRPSLKKLAKLIAYLLLSTSIAILASGAAAQLDTRDSLDGKSAIRRSINHVSLGMISLEPANNANTPSTSGATINPPTQQPAQPASSSGYIEDSTDSRLLMSKEALSLWSMNIHTILFGVGTGGFGAELHEKNPAYPLQSIVNNQYIETLTELGIIGLFALIILLTLPIYKLVRLKQWTPVAILSALYVQWLFFSGNINIPHIWVTLAIAYALPSYLYGTPSLRGDTSQSTLDRV